MGTVTPLCQTEGHGFCLVQKALGTYARLHHNVYRRTNGWIGRRLMLLPSLLMQTGGAKTGEARTTPLPFACDGGGPGPPGWYHSLKANPDIGISAGRERFAVTAQPVLPCETDREQL